MDQRELLLTLARDDEWRVVDAASAFPEQMARRSRRHVRAARVAWSKAGRAAAKQLRELKGAPLRSDVLETLRSAYAVASETSRDELDAAWSKGRVLGLKQANKLLRELGLDPVDPTIDESVFFAFRSDLLRNEQTIGPRFRDALDDSPQAVKKVANDLARRSRYTVDVASKRAASEAAAAAYAEAGVQKMWVARLIPGVTCSFCTALHGTVVDADAEFPIDPKLKVYQGLFGPPRHPNCGCVIVPYVSQRRGRSRNIAIREMMDQDLQPPAVVSAGDIRALPEATRQKFKGWLIAKMTGGRST